MNRIFKYFNLLLKYKSAYGIHSPFVFEFYNDVIKDTKHFYVFKEIEGERKILLNNHGKITVEDHGSGSKVINNKERTLSQITGSALSYPYQCRIIFRLIQKYKCANILELGTSLGISTVYMASVSKKSTVFSIEGDESVKMVAQSLFEKRGLENISLIQGTFKDQLAPVLKQIGKGNLDFAFIDGHHEEKATINYFNTIIDYCHENSIIMIDDINWSDGMRAAWKTISERPEIKLTIDLYFCGLVFLRKENREKENFKIRPSKLFYFLER